jgi:hypothetical protein
MMPQLAAERQLLAIEAASVPHMNEQGRRNVFRKYFAQIGEKAKPAKATPADIAALGIRVEQLDS